MPTIKNTGIFGTGAPFPDGTAAAPSINFINALDSGFFKTGDADAEISVSLEGGLRFQFRRLIGIDAFLGGAGVASLPGYTFVSDPDSGVFSAAANAVGISAAGVEQFRVISGQVQHAAGLVGSPGISFLTDPDTGIRVFGANNMIFVTGATDRWRITATGKFETLSFGTAAAPVISTQGETTTGIFFVTVNMIAITTAGVERYRVDASGNLTMRGDFDFTPLTDNTGDVGTAALRWKLVRAVTITSGDLQLESNPGEPEAKWTLREAPDKILAINRRTGKRYQLVLQETP